MSHRDRYTEHRPVRSPLGRMVAPSNGADGDFRDKARELWCQFGILVIWPDQNIGGWVEQQQRDNIGNRLYGKRRNGR